MSTISVIMPVYNAESYVEAAVKSILSQTYQDFELIAVDDGSVDGSLGVLKKLAVRDNRVRVISRENTGIVGALNDGLAAAKGAYVARMDADDLCEPDRFQLQMDRLKREPELVLVGSCASVIDPEGRKLGKVNVPLQHDEIEESHIGGNSCIFHPAAIIRTQAMRDVGGYRQNAWPCEDVDLWLRLGEVGRLANLPEHLFIWRWSLGSVVSRNRPAIRLALKWVMEDAWNRRNWSGPRKMPDVAIEPLGATYRRWGWLAIRHGHMATASKYGFKAVLAEPSSVKGWLLAFHGVKGWLGYSRSAQSSSGK